MACQPFATILVVIRKLTEGWPMFAVGIRMVVKMVVDYIFAQGI